MACCIVVILFPFCVSNNKKMNQKTLFVYSVLALVVFLFSNCASLTSFESGRTSGKNGGIFTASLNASKTPDFFFENIDSTNIPSFFFPNLEGSLKYGVLEKLDIGIKANTNLNLMIDAKYQIIGDQSSPAAVSLGLGVGSFGFPSPLWNVQIPVYFSLHPTEKMAIYATPRYTYQFLVGDLDSKIGHLGYTGGNVGILIGKDVRFGLDAGLYNVKAGNVIGKVDLETYLSFGIGVQVPF